MRSHLYMTSNSCLRQKTFCFPTDKMFWSVQFFLSWSHVIDQRINSAIHIADEQKTRMHQGGLNAAYLRQQIYHFSPSLVYFKTRDRH